MNPTTRRFDWSIDFSVDVDLTPHFKENVLYSLFAGVASFGCQIDDQAGQTIARAGVRGAFAGSTRSFPTAVTFLFPFLNTQALI